MMIETISQWIRSNGEEAPLLMVAPAEYDLEPILLDARQLAVCEAPQANPSDDRQVQQGTQHVTSLGSKVSGTPSCALPKLRQPAETKEGSPRRRGAKWGEKKQDTPCTTCTSCKRAAGNSHPDVVEIDKGTKPIRLKDVRVVLAHLNRTSVAGKRLIIIRNANMLLPEAANALLKQLEEYNASTRFLLTTSFPRRMLPTIRSRCYLIRIQQPLEDTNDLNSSCNNSTIAWDNIPTLDNHTEITEENVSAIAIMLTEQLKSNGASAALLRALLRLRDYHKILAQNGNVKLASDVLIAAISQLPHDKTQQVNVHK